MNPVQNIQKYLMPSAGFVLNNFTTKYIRKSFLKSDPALPPDKMKNIISRFGALFITSMIGEKVAKNKEIIEGASINFIIGTMKDLAGGDPKMADFFEIGGDDLEMETGNLYTGEDMLIGEDELIGEDMLIGEDEADMLIGEDEDYSDFEDDEDILSVEGEGSFSPSGE